MEGRRKVEEEERRERKRVDTRREGGDVAMNDRLVRIEWRLNDRGARKP